MLGNQKIAVIGGGSWGTALIKLLQNNVEDLGWWVHNKESVAHIINKKRNPKYLSYVELVTERIEISNDLRHFIREYDILVFAIPSAFLDQTLESFNLNSLNFENKIIVSAIKGIVPHSNQIVARYFKEKFEVPYENIGIIAGPCHAEEVAMQKLSYLTIAFLEKPKARFFANKLETWYMKVKTSNDIAGTEYSAMLKNIYALANGICIGLGYGDNFQAVLISNAIREMKRFVDAVHPLTRDIKNSAYLGDLLVTAYSQFSHNRTFGNMIGKGYSVKSAQLEMSMVAEGYYAVKGIYEIDKKYQIDLPITNAVYNILYERISPRIEFGLLTSLID